MNSATKVALIFDVESRLGIATALCLAKNGFRVCIVGQDRRKLQDLELQCNRTSSVKTIALVVNFAQDEFDPNYLIRRVIETCGRLDTFVLCSTPLCQQTDCRDLRSFNKYKQIMYNNVDKPIELILLAIQHLEKAGGNISFVSCLGCCEPGHKSYAHRISMNGLRSFIKCLALDLAPRIRVNMITVRFATSSRNQISNNIQNCCNCSVGQDDINHNINLDEFAQTIYQLTSEESASLTNGMEIIL